MPVYSFLNFELSRLLYRQKRNEEYCSATVLQHDATLSQGSGQNNITATLCIFPIEASIFSVKTVIMTSQVDTLIKHHTTHCPCTGVPSEQLSNNSKTIPDVIWYTIGYKTTALACSSLTYNDSDSCTSCLHQHHTGAGKTRLQLLKGDDYKCFHSCSMCWSAADR